MINAITTYIRSRYRHSAAGIAIVAAIAIIGSLAGITPLAAASTGRGLSRQPDQVGPAAPPTSAECVQLTGVACYSPRQVERAYDLLPLYAHGFTGKGRTIVIMDPFGSPTIRHDLTVFDRATGLPAPPSFQILQPAGPVPPYNPNNPVMVAKAGETTLDVEWSHAIAPGASMLLVETPGLTAENSLTGGGYAQLMAAENYVVEHNLGDVISQSFSLPEQNFPAGMIQHLRYAFVNAYRHHVTVLAASNDNGVTGPMPPLGQYFYQHRVVEWPASDPLVTAVGGTQLHLNASGQRISPDTAWNDTWNPAVVALLHTTPPVPLASNGGLSAIFSRPWYQDDVRGIVGDHRGVPDVSMSAALSGGVLTYESFPGNSASHGWGSGGGTSEATPEFAGIVAIADQYAGRRLGLINPALYLLSQRHAPGLVDVTHGNNTVSFTLPSGKIFTLQGYPATPGYDLVTGTGTVDAARLVPELAQLRWASPQR
jgi:subtilase family serine protease